MRGCWFNMVTNWRQCLADTRQNDINLLKYQIIDELKSQISERDEIIQSLRSRFEEEKTAEGKRIQQENSDNAPLEEEKTKKTPLVGAGAENGIVGKKWVGKFDDKKSWTTFRGNCAHYGGGDHLDFLRRITGEDSTAEMNQVKELRSQIKERDGVIDALRLKMESDARNDESSFSELLEEKADLMAQVDSLTQELREAWLECGCQEVELAEAVTEIVEYRRALDAMEGMLATELAAA